MGEVFNPTRERNEKAKNNGMRGELKAEKILKSSFNEVKFINRLIDYFADKKPIEVKTCQEWQSNGKRRCRGRFVLDKSQHNYLIKNKGYYLFIVLKEDGFLFNLLKADAINFNRKITWQKAFSYPSLIKGEVSNVG